ncbi:MAG: hypothetical protein AAF664_19825 [Planctomycetota bacterium]
MSENRFVIQSLHEVSHRLAIFEDDGTSGWLYLSAPDELKPIGDVWVHNRIEAPPVADIKNYFGGPPPAAAGYTEDSLRCHDPEDHSWSFAWDVTGEIVALLCDGCPIALLASFERRGWSTKLLRSGPWGNEWSNSTYFKYFPEV